MKNSLLREKRKERGLTQIEIAKLVGINSNTYVQYELGYRAIPIDKAKRISNLLQIKLDDFFVPKYLTLRKDKKK